MSGLRCMASSSIRKASRPNRARQSSPSFSPFATQWLDELPFVSYTFSIRSCNWGADDGSTEGPMLTAKQHELLNFINDRLSKTGVSPSFDEMREALDLKSKS